MTDLECYWRSGKTHALRRLPAHVRLHVEPNWHDVARVYVWLAVKTLAVGALIVIAYAVVAA